jgi:hypothetical protein
MAGGGAAREVTASLARYSAFSGIGFLEPAGNTPSVCRNREGLVLCAPG